MSKPLFGTAFLILSLSVLHTGNSHAQTLPTNSPAPNLAHVKAAKIDENYYQLAAPETEVTVLDELDNTEQLQSVQQYMEALNLQDIKDSLVNVKPSQKPFMSPEVTDDPLSIFQAVLKIWDIVQANKPVVNVQNKFTSALPEIAKDHWEKLVGWKPERAFSVHTTYHNLYQVKVVDLEYQVKLLYGGNVGGKGLYVASARVVPININVSWGFSLDVNVNVPAVFNAGSADNPLAAVQLDVNWTVKSVLKSDTTTETYQVQGDGLMKDTKRGNVVFSSAYGNETIN